MKKRWNKKKTTGSSNNGGLKPPAGCMGSNWFYFFLLGWLLWFFVFSNPMSNTEEISWNFLRDSLVAPQKVAKIEVINREVAEIYLKKEEPSEPEDEDTIDNFFSVPEGPRYRITIGSVETFENKLQQAEANLSAADGIELQYKTRTSWTSILTWLLPLGIIIFFWVYMLRRMRGGGMGGNPFSKFGKSTAKISEKGTKSSVTFEDVAGLQEAKVEVMEVVDFLKNPETYTQLGAKIPKGVMLVGPPGTGKTLMARAVAGEADVPFFSISGSEFVEMFIGVGASRVRDLFKKAKEKSPSIIFIDEIDSVGRTRGQANVHQSNDERESTLNQLLTELDGFGPNTGVIVIAATNRPDVLDQALLRPGRFDRSIHLELPTKAERKEIFEVHLKPLKLAPNVDREVLAQLSPGFSGADIANICNEAALIAARKKKSAVEQEDFMEARDRIVGGMERKSKIISDKERNIVAYHEAGHAVVSWYLKNVDSLVKVSIIPRGKSLGSTWYLPKERQIVTKAQFMDQMCALLGGRVAEDVIFDEISSGALDDLEKVTKQAYSMVAYYGLDKEIGPISFYDSTGRNNQMLGKPYSENMAEQIDKEVQQLVNDAYQRTKNLLIKHRDELEKLAELLLEQETVGKKDLEKILGKRKMEELVEGPKGDNKKPSIPQS
ncbi:ATP-dependent zinc metalloprotease FtsH [Pricia sp. S334]|uniref:ATP-dependent zinc metalloprotease FtsH n=1 Tax=Pricia mediterranea TaxID=3076079 RepID=A0ABU3L8H3_9FLAO|nr:ATP-dependent zinc metalloprotease FtsH [Pricia sp. S334]MDT7829863.1 ATP-dependent zinc metalloprotease FtsH [Pricia sp. S334]